jgi:hypothetical protein
MVLIFIGIFSKKVPFLVRVLVNFYEIVIWQTKLI